MVDEMKVELNLLYLEKVDYAILPWQQLSSAQQWLHPNSHLPRAGHSGLAQCLAHHMSWVFKTPLHFPSQLSSFYTVLAHTLKTY